MATLVASVKPVFETPRKFPRVDFMNTAMLWDFETEVASQARVNDISLGGCYLDTANPFPVGTRIRLSVVRGGEQFLAYAKVVYAASNLGMGLTFTHLAGGSREVLEKWISE